MEWRTTINRKDQPRGASKNYLNGSSMRLRTRVTHCHWWRSSRRCRLSRKIRRIIRLSIPKGRPRLHTHQQIPLLPLLSRRRRRFPPRRWPGFRRSQCRLLRRYRSRTRNGRPGWQRGAALRRQGMSLRTNLIRERSQCAALESNLPSTAQGAEWRGAAIEEQPSARDRRCLSHRINGIRVLREWASQKAGLGFLEWAESDSLRGWERTEKTQRQRIYRGGWGREAIGWLIHFLSVHWFGIWIETN